MRMDFLPKSHDNRKINAPDKVTKLNPRAKEFVPFSLRSTYGNTKGADSSSLDSSGKSTFGHAESSISGSSDDGAYQFWPFIDEIIPNFERLGEDKVPSHWQLSFTVPSISDHIEASRYSSSIARETFGTQEGTPLANNLRRNMGYFGSPTDLTANSRDKQYINGNQRITSRMEGQHYNGILNAGFVNNMLGDQTVEEDAADAIDPVENNMLCDGIESLRFLPSITNEIFGTQHGLSPSDTNNLNMKRNMGYSGSIYIKDQSSATHIDSATLINVNHRLAGRMEGKNYDGDSTVCAGNIILDDETVHNISSSQFPGFAPESLADMYSENYHDLDLIGKMLDQLENEGNGGFRQNLNSKSSSVRCLRNSDLHSVVEVHNALPKDTIDLNQDPDSYRSTSNVVRGATDLASTTKNILPLYNCHWKLERNGSAASKIGLNINSQLLASSYNCHGKLLYGDKSSSLGASQTASIWPENGEPMGRAANIYSESKKEAGNLADHQITSLDQLQHQENCGLSQDVSLKSLSVPRLSYPDLQSLSVTEAHNLLSNNTRYLHQVSDTFRPASSVVQGATDFASTSKIPPEDINHWKLESNGCADSNFGLSSSSHFLTSSSNGDGFLYGDKSPSLGACGRAPARLENGGPMESRKIALDRIGCQNASLEQAVRVYMIHNKAVAMELSEKQRLYDMQMKAADQLKAENSNNPKRYPSPFKLESNNNRGGENKDGYVIDLGGVQANYALNFLRAKLIGLKRKAQSTPGQGGMCASISLGSGPYGEETWTALQQFLSKENVLYSRPQPNLIDIIIR